MTRSRLRKLRRSRSAKARPILRVMPIASAIACAVHPAAAQEQPAETGGALQEVVVTAEKRVENLQNVPLSITAIGNQQLQDLNIQSQDAYVKFLPSVTTQKSGSG